MPRDTQIVRSALVAAPKDETVDKNVELILHSVHAQFRDDGAAGDWLPCVDLISDSGHTIARCCDPSVKVTAGDDAEVTWFPDVKPAGAPAGGPNVLPTAVLRKESTHTVAPGATYSFGFDQFETTDATVFKSFGPSFDFVSLPLPGLYQWWLSLYPDLGNDWPAAGAGNINFGVSITAAGPTDVAERHVFAQYPFVTYETGQVANDGTLVTTMGVKNIQNNGAAGAFITNNTAAPWTLGVGSFLYLVRLGDAVAF